MRLSPLPLRNQRGIALLYLVLFFTFLGALLSFGARMLAPSISRGKIVDTKAQLEQDISAITAWAVRNGRLPATIPTDEYATLFGAPPVDAWGKPVIYIYDADLAATATGGVCGRTGTSITLNGQNVAFVLLSGGEDLHLDSTYQASGAISGALAGLKASDIYRVVTLDELKAQAGCFGGTRGALRILNRELPNACRGEGYAVTLYSDGGVAPVSLVFSGLPAGLSATGALLSGTTTVAQGPYQVQVTATDSQLPAPHAVQMKYTLNVMSSCTH